VAEVRGVDYASFMEVHQRAEDRSLRLHHAVAQRLVEDPALVESARRRVAAWLEDGTVAREYAEAWTRLLAAPLDELVVALGERSERMHDLRQVSPFAGVLSPRDRWRLRREVAQ
jgi:hypothetical protein